MDALALVYFAKIVRVHVRTIGVCGYGYIHGYPRKICGYGYGWEISYPRQAWLLHLHVHRFFAVSCILLCAFTL